MADSRVNHTASPEVSVVVPVYNVEPWLRECLDSILGQTLENIEVICVNDGSTDNSVGILQEYAREDCRIKIIEQENKGISETRNAGVRASSGKYLFFMDSDDVLDSTALELCVSRMEQQDLEYVCFNAASFGENTESAKIAGTENRNYLRRHLKEEKVYTGQELFAQLKAERSYIAPVWTCMIAREAFLHHDLWFIPGILHEDEPWMFAVMMSLHRCGCIDRILYRRRIRAGSIMQSEVRFSNAYGVYKGLLDVQHRLAEDPELLPDDVYGDLAAEHVLGKQKATIYKYRRSSEEERQLRSRLAREERIAFEQTIAYPASLLDTIEQQSIEKRDLQKKYDVLAKQKNSLAGENVRLKAQIRQLKEERKRLKRKNTSLRRSWSYRIGHLITWLPGKLKRVFSRKKETLPVRNTMKVLASEVSGERIVYHYEVSGPWAVYFNTGNTIEVTYPFDLEQVPESIRILPFLAQVVPVSWVCDAEITVPECDEDFCDCLDAVKGGYREMYPMISFRGTLHTQKMAYEHTATEEKRTLACFSGGVDAISTTIGHLNENPILVSVWGADVPWNDAAGWEPIHKLICEDAQKLGLESITVRSSFRKLLPEGRLGELVAASGDGWWHGFQNGLGLLAHMAPVACALQADTVYIASSYTVGDVYTCASDPTIDNHVRFCGCRVVHDGYEMSRQDKIRRIVEYSTQHDQKIPLHVCWEKRGGDNCCHCEKCWRTMLGIYAQGEDPRKYGFTEFDGFSSLSEDLEKDYKQFKSNAAPFYGPIQKLLRDRFSEAEVPRELLWLYHADLHRVQDGTLRLYHGELVEPVYLLATPVHNNMGDQCITEAEKRFLSIALPGRCVIEISEEELIRKKYSQLDDIPSGMPVFLQGGGNLGTIWPIPETVRREIIRRLNQNPLIILPQSIWFSDDEAGLKDLDEAKTVYNRNDLLLCCREEVSLAFAKRHFGCRSILVPDMVMWETKKTAHPMERYGALMLLRSDKEQKTQEEEALKIQSVLAGRFRCIEKSDMIRGGKVTLENRPQRIEELVSQISSVECVVTDRLHGMILCAVTGTPCVALGNGYHKVESCGEWLKELGYIRFIRDVSELEEAIGSVCSCQNREYPESRMHDRFRPLLQYVEETDKVSMESVD